MHSGCRRPCCALRVEAELGSPGVRVAGAASMPHGASGASAPRGGGREQVRAQDDGAAKQRGPYPQAEGTASDQRGASRAPALGGSGWTPVGRLSARGATRPSWAAPVRRRTARPPTSAEPPGRQPGRVEGASQHTARMMTELDCAPPFRRRRPLACAVWNLQGKGHRGWTARQYRGMPTSCPEFQEEDMTEEVGETERGMPTSCPEAGLGAAPKPSKPVARHMSTQTGQAAGRGGVTPASARTPHPAARHASSD